MFARDILVTSMFVIEVAAISGALIMVVRCAKTNTRVKRHVDAANTITGVMRLVPFGVLVMSLALPGRFVPTEAHDLVTTQRKNFVLWLVFCVLGVIAGEALSRLTQTL